MNNLFVMHTQYNLILSEAVKSHYNTDHNTLILWSEFSVSEEIKKALNASFDNVIIVTDNYVMSKGIIQDTKYIRKCLKKVKCIKKEKYDRIYMSQDRVFDLIVFEMIKCNNRYAICCNIEEDAYYSLNNAYNSEHYVHKLNLRQKTQRLIYPFFLAGYPYDFKQKNYCYGMSKVYDEVALLFPSLARRELADKKLIEIKKDELINGIEAIYSEIRTEYPHSDKYMVMFFDLMSRYKNPNLIEQLVWGIIKQCEVQKRVVLVKYHPRETNKFSGFKNAFEIDKLIPAEKVLYDLQGKDVAVFGNATTACIVAAKLGYSVTSVCRLEIPDNIKMHNTMMQMGINCIANEDDMNF